MEPYFDSYEFKDRISFFDKNYKLSELNLFELFWLGESEFTYWIKLLLLFGPTTSNKIFLYIVSVCVCVCVL